MRKTRRTKMLGLLALPLIAIAVVAFIMALGQSTSQPAAATGPDDVILTVKDGATTCPASKPDADFCVRNGSAFTLSVEIVNAPANGYIVFQSYVQYGDTGLTYKKSGFSSEIVAPGMNGFRVGGQEDTNGDTNNDAFNHGMSTALTPPFPVSNFEGNAVEAPMNCPAGNADTQHVAALLPAGPEPAGTDGTLFVLPDNSQVIPKVGSITISCVPAPSPTPTPTPPPIPRWQKLPALQNLFVTGGLKPLRCNDATQSATFTEVLNQAIVTGDPKGFEAVQSIGAYEFEVRFDSKLVCVNIVTTSGTGTADDTAAEQAGMVCFTDDKDQGLQLEGIARLGCLTKGKDAPRPTSLILAYLVVRPQPEVLSQLKADQDNGIPVQLLDQGCELSDIQGHPIPIYSCEDADLTIRFLEGDVVDDCSVDINDQQMIAFRWGATKGSLVYNTRYDLEPSGFPSGGLHGDGDVDIKDIQFVYGRHGSTCVDQWPPQPPVNPKA